VLKHHTQKKNLLLLSLTTYQLMSTSIQLTVSGVRYAS
jgi:hypothetical protein